MYFSEIYIFLWVENPKDSIKNRNKKGQIYVYMQ